MRPIPESVETAGELRRLDPDLDILGVLQQMADRIRVIVPDCVGMSVRWLSHGVTFTLVASDAELAVLVADPPQDPSADADDLFDEERWRVSAGATAHRGVASTLTVPLTWLGSATGTATLYGRSGRSFDGHHEDLAVVLGGQASTVVRNADLAFTTRRTAEGAPVAVRERYDVEVAVGVVLSELDVEADVARERLRSAAVRAGITLPQLARALIELYG